MLIKHVTQELLGGVSKGVYYSVVYHVINYFFKLYLRPVFEEAFKEGLINYDVAKVTKALKKYEQANTVDERRDSFNDLP
jgi:hypothetical protein